MFPEGAVVRYVRSTKEPALAVVQGPSPHGDQYRTIVYKRGATGEHVQLFKTLWDCKRKFYTVPVQKKGQAENR